MKRPSLLLALSLAACVPPANPSPQGAVPLSREPYWVDKAGFMHTTGVGQAVPPSGIPCPSNDLRSLQPGTACYAAVERERKEIREQNARADRDARLLLHRPVRLPYGALLCGTPNDAIVMRNRLAFGSCKASHGGWGEFTNWDGRVGSYRVRLDSGEAGWMAAPVFETCASWEVTRRFLPDARPNPRCGVPGRD